MRHFVRGGGTLKLGVFVDGGRTGMKPRETMRVRITDQISGTMVLELEMAFEDFFKAVTGSADQPGTAEIFINAPWGLLHEVKVLPVPVPVDIVHSISPNVKARADYLERLKNAVRPFETEGWRATLEDAQNHHRRLKWVDGTAVLPIQQQTSYAGSKMSEKAIGTGLPKPPKGFEYYSVAFHRYVETPDTPAILKAGKR